MDDPVRHGWKARELGGFIGQVGPLWARREPDAWAYGILADDRHANPAGIVHGGLLTTLLDHAVSAIAWEANARKACVTVALDVHFVASARPGEFIEARGRIVRQAATLVFMQGSLTVQERTVATASAILKIAS